MILFNHRAFPGFTFLEALAVIGTSSILIVGLTVFMGRSFQLPREYSEQFRITEDARTRLFRMAVDISNGHPVQCPDGTQQDWLITANEDELTFINTPANGTGSQWVHYYVNPSNHLELKREVKDLNPANLCDLTTPASTETTLLGSLRNSEQAKAIFTYYNSQGQVTTDLGQVARVNIKLLIDVNTRQYPGALEIETGAAVKGASGAQCAGDLIGTQTNIFRYTDNFADEAISACQVYCGFTNNQCCGSNVTFTRSAQTDIITSACQCSSVPVTLPTTSAVPTLILPTSGGSSYTDYYKQCWDGTTCGLDSANQPYVGTPHCTSGCLIASPNPEPGQCSCECPPLRSPSPSSSASPSPTDTASPTATVSASPSPSATASPSLNPSPSPSILPPSPWPSGSVTPPPCPAPVYPTTTTLPDPSDPFVYQYVSDSQRGSVLVYRFYKASDYLSCMFLFKNASYCASTRSTYGPDAYRFLVNEVGQALQEVQGPCNGANCYKLPGLDLSIIGGGRTHLNHPTGLVFGGNKLFVADTGNNRVMVFDGEQTTQPHYQAQPALNVLGQPDFYTTTPAVTQSGMDAPVALAFDDKTNHLFVADQGNNRVLVYDTTNMTDGMNAIAVLGQTDFFSAFPGKPLPTTWVPSTQASLAVPSAVAFDGDHDLLYVGDRGNDRIMVFDGHNIVTGQDALTLAPTSMSTFPPSDLAAWIVEILFRGTQINSLAYHNNKLYVGRDDYMAAFHGPIWGLGLRPPDNVYGGACTVLSPPGCKDVVTTIFSGKGRASRLSLVDVSNVLNGSVPDYTKHPANDKYDAYSAGIAYDPVFDNITPEGPYSYYGSAGTYGALYSSNGNPGQIYDMRVSMTNISEVACNLLNYYTITDIHNYVFYFENCGNVDFTLAEDLKWCYGPHVSYPSDDSSHCAIGERFCMFSPGAPLRPWWDNMGSQWLHIPEGEASIHNAMPGDYNFQPRGAVFKTF